MALITCSFNYNQNIPPGYIECAWCLKIGMKLFTLDTKTGYKAFCSELCFTKCRRASFKKTKICDWCKHVRHTVNYVDFQDGEQQLQFCSNKCLNQYKMNIFCNETKAHLHLNPNLIKDSSKLTSITSKTSNLITPELWLKDLKTGDNDYNDSVNSFKGSSESDFDLNLEDSAASVSPQPMISHQSKRKFSEFSKDVNEFKPNERQKLIHKKSKSNKESKRVKHSNKLSNSSCVQSTGAKHSKHMMSSDSIQSNEWSSRDSNDKSSGFHSPSFGAHARHSPNPPSVSSHRTSMLAPNHNIQSNSGINRGIRTAAPLNPMVPNGSPPGPIFPRLSGNTVRGAPLIHPQPFGPRMPAMPNLLGVSQMEALARMQTSFAGFRPFLPFGAPPPPPPPNTGFPFVGLPHINGISPSNGSPLLRPSIAGNSCLPPTQLYPNCPVLPPMTVMVPYPVPIPIPIPIPVPFLFPFDKELLYKNQNQNNKSQRDFNTTDELNTGSHLNGTDGSNGVTTSSTTTSKIESVISKLVERKTRANSNQNSCVADIGLDLRTITTEDNDTNHNYIDSEDSLNS